MTTPNSFIIPGIGEFFKGKGTNKEPWRKVTEKEGPSPVGSPGSVILDCLALGLVVLFKIGDILSRRKT